MNPVLYSVSARDRVPDVLSMMLLLDVSAAPVVDAESAPIGFVSLRDLAKGRPSELVAERMSTPALTLAPDTELEDAARFFSQRDLHHVIAVDGDGRACGFVSLLDVVRGMMGQPSRHPPAFPQPDPEGGLPWTGTLPLILEQVDLAPDEPGVFILVGRDDKTVWSEATSSLRRALGRVLEGSHGLPRSLHDKVLEGQIQFRLAAFGPGPLGLGAALLE